MNIFVEDNTHGGKQDLEEYSQQNNRGKFATEILSIIKDYDRENSLGNYPHQVVHHVFYLAVILFPQYLATEIRYRRGESQPSHRESHYSE